MKKSKVIFIACLMGIALTGLIILQVNWIRHDLAIRQERFSQQVNSAMTKAVAKLETTESVQILTRTLPEAFDDSALSFFRKIPRGPIAPPVPPVAANPPVPPGPPVSPMDEFNIEMNDSLLELENSYSYSFDNGEEITEIVTSGARNKIKVAIHRGDSLRMIELEKAVERLADVQVINEKALKNLEKKRAKLKLDKVSNVLDKMAFEFDMRNAALLERVSPMHVDSIVGNELKNNGINIPYAISLNNGITDSVVWNRSLPDGAHPEKEFKTTLFPGDIINKSDYVKLGFADTFGYFVSSMWVMVLSSAFFTLIIILAFSYTVYVIFRQKKLSEIKNDFINNMTHEFKTPIATIRLASDAITNPDVLNDPSRVAYYSQIIRDENERMNGHVESILQMAQFDKNAFAPHLQIVNMHEVIEEAIRHFSLQVTEKGGRIVFNPGAGNPLIKADPAYIPFVILNLLDNSMKYCSKSPSIEVSTSNERDNLVITVADNGIGMDKSTTHKIFEKFYRVTSGNIHNVKGFGLGLNYVKAIVTAHNGTISVESEPGKGSVFKISFPHYHTTTNA